MSQAIILMRIFGLIYIIGITANTAALYLLSKRKTSVHILLLKCLALNDLISQIGMFTLLLSKEHNFIPIKQTCILYVILRAFGLGSGLIALLMAIERWLALTRPFMYIKLMTYKALKWTALLFWCTGAIVTYLPLLNFGTYAEENGKCTRYRLAKLPKDKAYAYLFFTFGTTLCLLIISCNVSVFCALKKLSKRKASIVGTTVKIAEQPTAEEMLFAKLMAVLSIVFILCWLPDMVMVPWSQIEPNSKLLNKLTMIGDCLKVLYFTVDPFLYVIYGNLGRKLCRHPCMKKDENCKTSKTLSTVSQSSALIEPNKF